MSRIVNFELKTVDGAPPVGARSQLDPGLETPVMKRSMKLQVEHTDVSDLRKALSWH